MKYGIRLVALLLGVAFFVPQFGFAQTATTSTSTVTQLMQQLKDLQAQIDALQKQKKDINQELKRSLSLGTQGDDVKTIQVLLASDPSLYPEGKVTGYFGALTVKAIKKFQQRHGIDAVGFVGPKTLKKLNELLAEGFLVITAPQDATSTPTISINPALAVATSTNCLITPPGHLIAPGYLKKENRENEDDDNDRGKGKEKKEKEREGRPFSIPCNFLPPGIWKKIDHGTTTPPVVDTAAPVISNVSVSNIATSSATVNWTTNESAYGELAYGTSTAYSVTTPWSTSAATGFSQALSGLTASTTYHFSISAKDLVGNVATSSDIVFTTAAVPPADTTPPVISSVAATSVASTTTTVTWATNESATSKVYYGTSTPLSLAGALSGSDTTMVTSHSIGLSGLTASSTYYYVVESKDGAGNTATSTENSFGTLP